MHDIFQPLAKIQIFNRSIITRVIAALAILFLSYLGYIFPWLNWIVFWLICAGAIALTILRTEEGILLLLFELFLGSKGYLFSFPAVGEFVVSLRLALFIIVLGIWFAKKIVSSRQRTTLTRVTGSPFFLPFLGLIAAIALGLGVGIVQGHSLSLIFFDANAYIYWLVLIPLLDTLNTVGQIEKILRLFFATCIAISLTTILLFADFAIFHQDARPDAAGNISTELAIDENNPEDATKISQSTTAKQELTEFEFKRAQEKANVPQVYRWAQDTGMAEISYLSGRFFRIFFVSQIFIMLAALIMWMLLVSGPEWISRAHLPLYRGLFVLFALTTLLSFSRSLWLGLAAGIMFSLVHLPPKKVARLITAALVCVMTIGVCVRIAAPSTFRAWTDRALSITQPTKEKSATNRINLLVPVQEKITARPIIGNGFGTTIEYESVTPEKQGLLRVYLVEWTYLDIWMKLGIIGLGAYSALLIVVFQEGYRFLKQKITPAADLLKEIHAQEYNRTKGSRGVLVIALLVALFGFLITNVTTPYLNHPLGIGFLLLVIGTIHVCAQEMQRVVTLSNEHPHNNRHIQ